MSAVALRRIADLLDGRLEGDGDRLISGAQRIEKATAEEITFVADRSNVRKLIESNAGAVIAGDGLRDFLSEQGVPQPILFVADARAGFARVLEEFHPRPEPKCFGVSPNASVAPSAQIAPSTNVHPGAHIAENVTVGENCEIHPGVYVGPNCTLGDEVQLYPNVVIYRDVTIGNRVTVHASAVLGGDGFGYRFEGGQYHKLRHFGAVRIEDDVEIGSCTTIDRALVDETVIGAGTKVDSLVRIAHNCRLGRHNVLVGQVGFAGSVTTGDYVTCAGQVGVAGHLHLGEGCTLGAKAGVHKDLPGGQTYLGAPAAPEAEATKSVMAQRKLPEMRKQLRRLEQQVAELSAQLETSASSKTTCNDAA